MCAGGGEGNRYALSIKQVTPVAYLQEQHVLSTHCIICMVCRCWGHQERHNSHRHWMEQCLTHTEKRQSRISFSGECQSPMVASGSHPAADIGRWLMLQPKDLALFLQEIETAGGWPDAIWCTCLGRTKKYVSSLEQGETFPSKERCPEQDIRVLYLFVRTNSKPGHIFLWPRRDQKSMCTWLPVPTSCFQQWLVCF